ncbi:MAG: IPT/TIG domain-containing protein [Planctomycetales bacterium]|nr:IPT/TIG domain-containing protein [Planctomycetales bacterium]
MGIRTALVLGLVAACAAGCLRPPRTPRYAPSPPPGPAPVAIVPSSGPTTGGTAVTITGGSLQTGAGVTIGGSPATSVVVFSPTQITVLTPAGPAGPANVTVTNPDGQSGTLGGGFGYLATPAVTGASPSSGDPSGGTPVTITGTGLAAGATVLFGTSPATGVTVLSSTSLTCVTPAGTAGSVSVTVTNPSGLSGTLANAFTYATGGTLPTVSSVSPATGPSAGGTLVTLTGSNFQTGAGVTIGGAAASSVTLVSSTTITAVAPRAPPGTAGALAVTVTNTGGASGSLAAAFSYSPTPVETITDTAADADVAVDGSGRIHVVWHRTTSGFAEDILYVRSTGGGLTWTATPVNLEQSSNSVSRPRVAARGSTVFVVWNELVSGSDEVYSSYSTDGGATWSTPAALTSNPGTMPDPDVAMDGNGTVIVAYGVFGGQNAQGQFFWPIHSRSGTAGGTFSLPRLVGGALASSPSVAADGNGIVVVAWEDFPLASTNPNQGLDIWVARSADGGATWGPSRNQTNTGGNVNSHSPAVALRGSSAVLAWTAEWPAGSPANYRIRAAGSTDAGVTWAAAPVDVSGSMAAAYPAPSVAADGNGTFTVAWSESVGSPANAEILSSRTTDAGQSFSVPVNLSSNSGSSWAPAVAGGAGSFLIHVWEDNTASGFYYDVLSR